MQIRACPIELSWELPNDCGNLDPLRILSSSIRRQQPTPLKYLFRCSPIPTSGVLRNLTITDLISQLTCHITINNSWSVLFSDILRQYFSVHPVIQISTQSILHWAVKCGFATVPPAVSDHASRYAKSDGPVPTTHSNLSVILVMWIRYLIEVYPQLPTVSELFLDGSSIPVIEVSETVEVLLVRFFDFYRSVDFASSVISIRAGAPPLNRLEYPINTKGVALVVIDPIIDRNLAGTWQPNHIEALIKELQIIPWSSSELFCGFQNIEKNDNESHLVTVLLKESHLMSQWLLALFDNPAVAANPLQFESLHHETKSLSLNLSNIGQREPSDFPSRSDLVAELDSMRITQQILTDKIRFLRNDIWWLERKSTTGVPRRERTGSGVSLSSRLQSINEESHWTSIHFGSKIKKPLNCSSDRSDGILLPPACAPPVGRARMDTLNPGIDSRNSDLKASNSPLPDSVGMTTASGSTPPIAFDSPGEDHSNHSTVERLNDTVSMLLELTGYPKELLPTEFLSRSKDGRVKAKMDDDQNEEPSSFAQITPSSEYLSSLVEKHMGGGTWNWDRSPQLQHLVHELLRDSGIRINVLDIFSFL